MNLKMKIPTSDDPHPQILSKSLDICANGTRISSFLFYFILHYLWVQAGSGLFGNTSFEAGYDHSLYIKNDGSLWAVGDNTYGQLGDGTTTDRITPVQIESSGVTMVSASFEHSMYLKSDGSLWAMGRNNSGQLGDGTTDDRITPRTDRIERCGLCLCWHIFQSLCEK